MIRTNKNLLRYLHQCFIQYHTVFLYYCGYLQLTSYLPPYKMYSSIPKVPHQNLYQLMYHYY